MPRTAFISDIYTRAVHENLHPLYANWEPGKPVELGDYGPMCDHSFIYLGNIRDLGIDFAVRDDPTKDRKSFATQGSTEVNFHAKGSTTVEHVVNANASLEIKFSSEEGVFFNAADCLFKMIRDKTGVGREIMERFTKEPPEWDRSWAVVTDLVTAGSTTVAVSGGKNSSITFEAKGDVERIDLADASMGLNLAGGTNVGYNVVAEQGLIPLIGLSKIQSAHMWSSPDFRPCFFSRSDRMRGVMNNSPHIRTEETPKDLYFGVLNDPWA